MKKTYRSVWNESTGTWVAAQEKATASGKGTTRTRAIIAVGSASVGAASFLVPATAWADFCAAHAGQLYNYTATGVASNCNAWISTGLVGGGVVGKSYFDAMGVGYTQIVSDGTQRKIFLSPGNPSSNNTMGYYATLSSAATGVLFSGLNPGLASADAVNVSQLKPLVTALGGGTSFNASTGAVTGPTYVVAGTPYHDVGSALDALNKSASNPDVVLYDSSTHDSVTLRGAGSTTPVALRNVAKGAVTASSTDAVNGAQLYDVKQEIDNKATHYVGINSDPGQGNYNGEGATGTNAIAIGANTTAAGAQSTAFGAGAYAAGDALAAGAGAQAFSGSVALGAKALAQWDNSIAIGNGASVGGSNTVAIGSAAVSNFAGDVALGANSTTDVAVATPGTTIRGANYTFAGSTPLSTVSVGSAGQERTITNVAAGQLTASSTDAVNGSQLFATNQAISKLTYIDAFGSGTPAQSSSLNSVALGFGSVADAPRTISVGNSATGLLRKITNVATGQAETDAVNLGQVEALLGIKPTDTVSLSSRLSANTSAIATLDARLLAAAAPNSSTGALDGATTTDTDALHYDSAAHDIVTLSSASGGNVQLTGLQNAALDLSSTDAVTGQQLFATNQQLNNLSQAVQNINITGSTAVGANTTSGAAAAAGTQSVAVGGGATATGNNTTAIGDMANASAKNAVALGANSVADRENSVSVGAAGSERQIVNVAAGTQGTDAVNLNQLNNAITQQSNGFNQQIGNLQNSINTVSKNAYAGVAAAMAMPNLTPSGPGRTVVAAGGGYYMGGSAAAVGVTYRSANMHWLVNGGVSLTSTGNMAARTQVGYEF
ncbi:YadA-like family protein [Paraburkholderia flagellata]|uniref:YadA-like family protein n=1 Tax=Paraburkholderia flagellata TaxID=2883241 RepID=UPI0027E3E30F|nr:YadA-like family protein [Paraburkholderia flagellata]